MLFRCPQHPKMTALREQLKISLPMAVGLLELLWHYTGRYAPQGNIGQWDNAAIKDATGWLREADELVTALVKSRWLDKNDPHRLLVHDWPDHCDNIVHMHLAKQRLLFATGQRPNLKRFKLSTRAEISADYDALDKNGPALRNKAKKKAPKKKAEPAEIVPPALWDVFWALYPRKSNKKTAKESWAKAATTAAKAREITDGLRRALDAGEFNCDKQYMPHPSTWLNQCRWQDEHEAEAVGAKPQVESREPTDADILEALGDATPEDEPDDGI